MRLMWGLLPPGAADHLAFDNRRCGVVPVEMPADDPEIAGVGAESEVEQVACYGNGAKRGIDRRIDANARALPLRNAKIARFPDDITRPKRNHDSQPAERTVAHKR